ncbi:MAG: Rieske [2Fe-2S] iron-sulfur [Candidatus Magnetoglobus multicellularis str. Araruama]|uniref:Rieske [2Fe-2S] iron-sulfur n=1 Tax=Candidatus Magnetoglobus multicellularis str. Araruama TaxID=890399 RepID=A0A1V1PEA5_9BACT|nr:MAG: Rieske [2Fe-2S] iron-sulfur [Candidatus Magnetoglobus multicellularis str. Araruama]
MKTIKRNIFQRLFGLCATQKPSDNQCWTVTDGKLEIDINRAKELNAPGSAIRLEGNNLPNRLLICHGTDGKYHAFINKCKHMGRRMDPVPETQTIQCCSVGKTTYDYNGKVLFGSAKEPLEKLTVEKSTDMIVIRL